MRATLIGALVLVLAVVAAPVAPRCQDLALPPSGIEGADSPVFRAALEDWLHGDDQHALPSLGELARQDNLAAQILLGIIYDRGLMRTAWIAGLSLAERRALFRFDDGRFGVPWLRHAADRSELAGLIIQASPDEQGNFSADAGLRAAAAGEPRSTVRLLGILLNQGTWAEAVRLAAVAETYDMQAMAWAAATYLATDKARALRERGLAEFRARTLQGWIFATLADRLFDAELEAILAPHDPMRIYVSRGRLPLDTADPPPPGGEAVLDALLADAPEADLPRRYCRRVCAAEAPLCTRQIYGMLAGYMTLPHAVSSPVETLIPQDVWVTTRRAEIVLEQYVLNATHARPDPAAAFETLRLAPCLRDALRPALVLP